MTSLKVSVTIDPAIYRSDSLCDVIHRKGKNVQGRTCTKSRSQCSAGKKANCMPRQSRASDPSFFLQLRRKELLFQKPKYGDLRWSQNL